MALGLRVAFLFGRCEGLVFMVRGLGLRNVGLGSSSFST